MKKLFFIVLLVVLFFSCNNNDQTDIIVDQQPIDESILGTWKVIYSMTIDSVMFVTNDSLAGIANKLKLDTVEYTGETNTKIASYMFAEKENIIEIRSDNQIKVYFINDRGGITITDNYIPYYINNKMLIYTDKKGRLFYNYTLNGDTLTIERIPDEMVMWKYKLSKYCRIDNI